MAEESVKERLKELDKLISGTGNTYPGNRRAVKYNVYNCDELDRMGQIVDQLNYVFENDTEIDLELNLISLFHEENGILKIMDAIIDCKGLEKIKQSIIRFLKVFYNNHKDRLLIQQVADLRECFLNYAVNAETTAKEKELSLENLLCILESKRHMLDVHAEEALKSLCDFGALYKNPSMRVMKRIFEAKGMMCKQYTNIDRALVTRVVKDTLIVLDQQKNLNISDHKAYLVEGSILCMRLILYEYAIEQDEGKCSQLYYALKHFLSRNFLDQSYKGVQKAGLLLLIEHGIKFSTFVYQDYKYWHETFLSWVAHDNPEVHRMGYAGVSAFYTIMAHALQDRTEQQDTSVFKYFMTYFQDTVISNRSAKASYEVSLAIQGFGQFSGPCKVHLSPKEVNVMFTGILARAEEYLKQSSEQTLDYLSKYVQALGSIVAHIESLGPQYKSALQCLCVLLFEKFPTMSAYTHHGSIVALLKTFDSLSTKGTLIDTFLPDVVYQAIIRSCSYPVKADAELLMEKMTPFQIYQFITYDRYLPLWEGLLQTESLVLDKVGDLSQERLRIISTKVFDSFMQSLLRLLNKLDLETHERPRKEHTDVDMYSPDQQSDLDIADNKDQYPLMEVMGMDPETSLVASHPKDFRVLLNVVDLCQDLLPKVDKDRFSKWALKFAQRLMVHASHLPLVSSFYKLLTLCLNLCNKMNLFKDIEGDLLGNDERRQCLLQLGKFLREVLTELVQYKDDLQLACLHLILAAPLSLVPELLPFTPPAFQAIFSAGQIYLPLAAAGISTLNVWCSALPADKLEPLLLKTIPCFDSFLQSKDLSDGCDAPAELMQLKVNKNAKLKNSGRMPRSYAGERASDLAKLQRDILLFLAQLETPTCLSLVEVSDELASQQAVSWASSQVVKFNIPFQDLKASVYLDKILPRVSVLALRCSDRSTRITSCELLHSITVCMLGTATQNSRDQSSMTRLFRRVVPVVLRLGCDQDILVQQIFQPLLVQMTHYFSSNQMKASDNTAVLLQTLLDCIADPKNMSVRDLAATSLREFVVWTIRQQSTEADNTIKKILRQMYSFSQHPDPYKRLGTALAVNSLYTVLREQSSLVEKNWLELLYYLVSSLQMVQSEEAVLGIMQQTHKAIDHLERVLCEWSDRFNEENASRRQPPDFTGICLKDAVAWLLCLCSSPHFACRTACMKLVTNLAPKISDVTDGRSGIKISIELISASLVNVCESQVQEREGLQLEPKEETQQQCVLTWLQQLLGSLECYTWLLEKDLANPLEIFSNNTDPNIFKACANFTKLISKNYLEKFNLSPREMEEFEHLQCEIMLFILDFVYCLVTSGGNDLSNVPLDKILHKHSEPLWCLEWWKLATLMTLKPEQLGFTLNAYRVTSKLEDKLCRCLSMLPQKLPQTTLQVMYDSFNNCLEEHSEELGNLTNLKNIAKNGASGKIINYTKGLIILHETGLAPHLNKGLVQLQERDGNEVMQKVFDSLSESRFGISYAILQAPGVDDYLNAILKVAFMIGVKKERVLEKLQDQTVLEDEVSRVFVTPGEVFLLRLKPTVVEYLLQSPAESASAILAPNSIGLVHINICHFLLTNVFDRPHLKIRYGAEVSAAIMHHWPMIRECEQQHLLEIIDLLAYIATLAGKNDKHLKTITEWLSAQLASTSHPLHVKTRCLDIAMSVLTWDAVHHQILRNALNKLGQSLPLTSAEYPPQSSQRAEYTTFFTRILALVRQSQNMQLLDFVVCIAMREAQHVCHNIILLTLQKMMARVPGKQLEIIKEIFEKFLDEEELPENRLSVVNQFIVPMLYASSADTVEAFFLHHISFLGSKLLKDLVVNTPSIFKVKRQLAVCTSGWSLIQVLYTMVKTEKFDSASPLSQEYAQGESNKKLNLDFCSKAFNIRKESLEIPDPCNSLYRQYQCAALKAVISILCCRYPDVIKENARFTKMIFTSKTSMSSASERFSVWPRIINCSTDIPLKMDFEEIPQKETRLACIRKDAQKTHASKNPGIMLGSIKYVASLELFDSSLCEDITKFDLSYVDVRSHREDGGLTTEANASVQEEIMLDLDLINQHECMATMCALVRHLLAPLSPSPEETNPPLPTWMKLLSFDFTDFDFELNVRLFILKLVINCEDVIRPYATHWLAPICNVIGNGRLGNRMNYMISDAVLMITSWHEIAIPTNQIQIIHANELLEYLMKHADHRRRDILKHNFDLIKTVIEVWKNVPNLKMPYNVLTIKVDSEERSQNPEVYLRHLYVKLNLAAILIANKIAPWNEDNKRDYLESLVDVHLMQLTNSRIYLLAAEVLGMILKWTLEEPDVGIPELERKTRNNLISMYKGNNKDIFHKCLYRVFKHYNSIADSFFNRIIHEYPNNISQFKTQCLEMIVSRFEELDDKKRDTSNLGLLRLMTDKSAEDQELALKLIAKLLKYLDHKMALNYIKEIPKVLVQSGPSYRLLAYKVLMEVYRHSNSFPDTHRELSVAGLLQGLQDPDDAVQQEVLDFWTSNDVGMPTNVADRFLFLFKTLFYPQHAHYFLSNFIYLLLEASVNTTDYTEPVFQSNLTDRYKKYPLSVSWRSQYAAMTPMFAETLAGQIASKSLSISTMATGKLKATQQQLQFEPTLGRQEEVEEGAEEDFSFASADKKPSSTSADQTKTWRPKYRFFSDQKRHKIFFAQKTNQMKARQMQLLKDQKARVQGKVHIYRDYRFGDYPDIQIPHSAVIKPLQALAKRDPSIARLLFVLLYRGITEKRDSHAFSLDVHGQLQRIFEESMPCVPMLVGAALEVAIENGLVFDPQRVSDASRTNKLAPMGCLLLEKYLSGGDTDVPVPKARRLTSDQPSPQEQRKQQMWFRMAELYQALEERELVLAVYQQALKDVEPGSDLLAIQKAVKQEAEFALEQAQNTYRHFLDSSSESELMKTFSTQAYCKCLEKLSNWSVLNTWVVQEISNDGDLNEVWTNTWKKDNLLPWLMNSELHDILDSFEDDHNFTERVNEWLEEQTKAPHLQSQYSEQLSMFSLISDRVEKSRFHARTVLQGFLEEWSVLSSLLPHLRAQKLGQLQSVAEIILFTEGSTLKVINEKNYVERMKSLSQVWMRSNPKPVDSLLTWENRVLYRSFFSRHARGKLAAKHRGETELISDLKKITHTQELSFIDLAITQKQFNVAQKFLARNKDLKKDADFSLKFKIALSRGKWLLGETSTESVMKVIAILTAFVELRKAVDGDDGTQLAGMRSRAERELAEMAWAGSRVIQQYGHLINHPQVLPLLTNFNAKDAVGLADELEMLGQQQAWHAVQSMQDEAENGAAVCPVEAMLCVVRHHRALLQEDKATDDHLEQLVKCLLRAMHWGSQEARMLFPCLLQIPALSSKALLKKLFKTEVKNVPVWMFLGWTNQLLAHIGTDTVTLIDELLLNVATEYPKALVLPFQFTLENLNNLQDTLSATTLSLLNKLKRMLQLDTMTDTLLKSFKYVTQPETLLFNHLVSVVKCLDQPQQVRTIFKQMCEELFPVQGAEPQPLRGLIYEELRNKYKSKIEKVLKPLMTKIPDAQLKSDSKKSLALVVEELQKQRKFNTDSKFKYRMLLKVYSPWLGQFNQCKLNCNIEIPGQYTGDKPPQPQYHVTFCKFDPLVQVMSSMRHPVRISCVGNNGRSYHFLIKTGEDLRQDERIQQVLRIMNGVLAQDPQCAARKLRLDTYQVIPLSSSLGIIEFVQDCTPLQDFATSGGNTAEANLQLRKLSMKFVNTLNEETEKMNYNPKPPTYDLWHTYSRGRAVAFFQELVAHLPRQDMLMQAFQALSSAPEGLYWLRHNFGCSIGVMSIAHWLLGVGDRHLNNMLISHHTGAALGIDFGHAFGSATQLLPVPELMPFRLTEIMLNLMGPLRHEGLLRSSMVYTLRALRNNSEVLCCVMQVFVQEPSLDWQENAAKLAARFGKSDDARLDSYESGQSEVIKEVKGFAQEKMHLARCKLQGALPAVVMEKELREGVKGSSQVLNHILDTLQGSKDSERSKLRTRVEAELKKAGKEVTLENLMSYSLSEEQQVTCLIDQATDPNLLCKTWQGWAAWV